MLEEESHIAPEIIEARGYWTAETVEELEAKTDIKPNQYYAPALVLPIYGVDGRYRYSRVRPDNPPPDKGKYLQPAATANVLDIPRTVLDKVMDTSLTLVITEGEKKCDYLASHGMAAVGLFGVWNWAHKVNEGTPYETQILLPDFDEIPLYGRKVSILFDCDARLNKNIQMAASRLARQLMGRGAELW
jgi:hypothetical protein